MAGARLLDGVPGRWGNISTILMATQEIDPKHGMLWRCKENGPRLLLVILVID